MSSVDGLFGVVRVRLGDAVLDTATTRAQRVWPERRRDASGVHGALRGEFGGPMASRGEKGKARDRTVRQRQAGRMETWGERWIQREYGKETKRARTIAAINERTRDERQKKGRERGSSVCRNDK